MSNILEFGEEFDYQDINAPRREQMQKSFIQDEESIEKGNVKGHWRTTKSGKKVFVKDHSNAKTKKDSLSAKEKRGIEERTKERAEKIDYLSDYEKQPKEVQAIMETLSEGDEYGSDSPDGLEAAQKKLAAIGWKMEYGLDGGVHTLEPIQNKKKALPKYDQSSIDQAAKHISSMTGTRDSAVKDFASENNIDIMKLATYVGSKKIKPMDFSTAISGNKGNPYATKIVDALTKSHEETIEKGGSKQITITHNKTGKELTGRWVTINGSHVFVSGGGVEIGAKEIKNYSEGKGGSGKSEDTKGKKALKEVQNKDDFARKNISGDERRALKSKYDGMSKDERAGRTWEAYLNDEAKKKGGDSSEKTSEKTSGKKSEIEAVKPGETVTEKDVNPVEKKDESYKKTDKWKALHSNDKKSIEAAKNLKHLDLDKLTSSEYSDLQEMFVIVEMEMPRSEITAGDEIAFRLQYANADEKFNGVSLKDMYKLDAGNAADSKAMNKWSEAKEKKVNDALDAFEKEVQKEIDEKNQVVQQVAKEGVNMKNIASIISSSIAIEYFTEELNEDILNQLTALDKKYNKPVDPNQQRMFKSVQSITDRIEGISDKLDSLI